MTLPNTDLKELMAALRSNRGAELKFVMGESIINPGYHVTEIRHATINSIDCGKSSSVEQWDEITIQLLDGSPTSNGEHMQASKFNSIFQKAIELLGADSSPVLFFEFSPNNGPIRKLSIESINQSDNAISVILGSEKAVCKPFQRSKAAQAAALSIGGKHNPAPAGGGCCSSSVGCCA